MCLIAESSGVTIGVAGVLGAALIVAVLGLVACVGCILWFCRTLILPLADRPTVMLRVPEKARADRVDRTGQVARLADPVPVGRLAPAATPPEDENEDAVQMEYR